MVAQAGPMHPRDFRLSRIRGFPLGKLLGFEAGQRVSRQFRVLAGNLPQQFQEQRKRPRRMLMLQRTMFRE
jgi:hypothetical protein